MSHQDVIMLILHHHDTVVRASWIVAINMTLRSRHDGKQLSQYLLLTGQIRTNIVDPSLDRRLGNGNQKERGKEQSYVPETDTVYHCQIAGQADNAVAHMLS